jgi:hypothetical protein
MTIKVRKQLSLEMILNKVSELDIYRRYIGNDVKVKQMISSPLRSGDSDPSFRLYYSNGGYLRYVDYGTGQKGGIIDLVSQIYPYMTYGELLERIWEDLHCEGLPYFSYGVKKQVKKHNVFPKILVKKRVVRENDIEFWESWGISRSTLNWGRVTPISKFWIGDNVYGCRTPSYAYDLFTEWKIYRPHEERLRFIAGGTALQGYRLLPDKGEVCIIQKSYKDVLLLHEFDIPSFAPQAESVDVPKKEMESILNRFDKVFIWGDPDNAGDRFMERHVSEYGITPIKNTCDTKDITDHAKKYGKESARIMMKELIR